MKKIFLILLLCFAGLVIAFLALAGLSSYLDYLATAPLSKAPEHGTELIIEADFSQAPGNTNMAPLEKALQKRFSGIGARAFMEPVSASKLRIVLPAAESNIVGEIGDNITRAGFLEFRLVNDNSEEIVKNNEPIPNGYEMLQSLQLVPGQKLPERLIVKKKPEDGLAGDFVQSAAVTYGNMGEPQIEFEMNKNATARFAQVTTEYAPDKPTGVRHRVAVILDGQLYSAPQIEGPIVDGYCMISGSFTEEDARRLAQLLNDPLPARVKIIETNSF
jgi:preprotein translocase subunit SecD